MENRQVSGIIKCKIICRKTITVLGLIFAIMMLSSCTRTGSVFDDPSYTSGNVENKLSDNDSGNNGDGQDNSDAGSENNASGNHSTDDMENAGNDGQNGTGNGSDSVNAAKYPDDNPANHGKTAIMETENGYYYDFGWGMARTSDDGLFSYYYTLALSYYDKASGDAILLCAKPECEHDHDENCVATYKGIETIGTVLYDGYIYIYGLEKDGMLLMLNLYRATLDGSHIDKVATVLEADNPTGASYIYEQTNYGSENYFIIHRGSAYIPYFLRIGKGSKGFMGGGLMKVDLANGEKKQIVNMQYFTDPYPISLCGAGDYVYMHLVGGSVSGEKRYSISRDTLADCTYANAYNEHYIFSVSTSKMLKEIYEQLTGVTIEEGADSSSSADNTEKNENAVIVKSIYDEVRDGGHLVVQVRDEYGHELGEKRIGIDIADEEFDGIKGHNYIFEMNTYKDMLVVVFNNRIMLYGIGNDNWGTKLGEIDYVDPRAPEKSISTKRTVYSSNSIKVCNDRIYRVIENLISEGTYDDSAEDFDSKYIVEYCEISDVLAGKNEWHRAFSYKLGK